MDKRVTIREEFEKNKELNETDLGSIKQWYSKQPHLPTVTDELLVLFLHSCDYNLEVTKTVIDNYFTVRTHVPDFFDNRNPFVVNIHEGKPIIHYGLLNKRSPEGYKIMILKLADLDPTHYVFSEQIKAFHMHVDIELYLRGTFPGLIIVFDMTGVTFGHVSRLNVMHVKKVLYYVQEAMPVKLKGIHYINAVSFMDVIMGMVKPFMKKNLLEVLHIHAQGMESFYKFVPKEILPRDFGGNDFLMEELHEKSLKIIQDHKKWFEEECKLRVDETKRIGKFKHSELFGMEGSFKKLNID